MGWEVPVLSQNTAWLAAQGSLDNFRVRISKYVVGAEVRTNSVTVLPSGHIFTYGDNLSWHVWARNNAVFSVVERISLENLL